MIDTINEKRIENNEEFSKIKNFTDMKVWQENRKLVKNTYRATYLFPDSEKYALVTQMRRAVISVASNIAEGFRRETMKDKLHFYVMSHGSLSELQCQIILSLDLEFLDERSYDDIAILSNRVDALLMGLIKATRERI